MPKQPPDLAAQDFIVKVGARLRQAREAKDLSMLNVAGRIGVSKAAVGHWEKGINPIDIRRLFSVARLYETTVVALLADSITGDDAVALIKREIDAAAANGRPEPSVAVSARGDRYPVLPRPPAADPKPKSPAPGAKRRTPT